MKRGDTMNRGSMKNLMAGSVKTLMAGLSSKRLDNTPLLKRPLVQAQQMRCLALISHNNMKGARRGHSSPLPLPTLTIFRSLQAR